MEYLLILTNAVALWLLTVGLLLVQSRRVGGLHHWRIGRIGGSFYVARRH